MTAHETFTALFWIVAGGYAAYVVWFVVSSLRTHTARRRRPGP